jgi:hypothetical protein
VLLRLVSYQLPDGCVVRVLTDRFDLSALSVAQLYKERWKTENWWKWIKAMLKIKEPLSPLSQRLADPDCRRLRHRFVVARVQTCWGLHWQPL